MRTTTIYVLSLALLAALSYASTTVTAEEPVRKPTVRIVSPRGGQTHERLITISGHTEDHDADRLTLVLNGVALSIPKKDEGFSTTQVLAPGLNTIRVLATDRGGTASDQADVYALVPPKDLRITLTWDTPGTDVDLWVTGPDGEKINYQNKQGKAGGTLDTDVTNGYGPETYTQARAEPGTYRVQANYYSGLPPTRVTLNVIRGEGTPDETRRVFRGVLLKAKDVVEVGEFTVAR